jgi:hypothetical protein
MPEELPVSNCPRCDSSEFVRPKLLATNFLLQTHFVESFTVEKPSQFRDSPYTFGDHFVSGLFCDHCDLGFVPDEVAASMGVDPCRYRGQLTLSCRPFGVGYTRSDVSYDGSGTAVRPFDAIIWQPVPDSVGIRVTIHALSLDEAQRILELEHGSDVIYTLWNQNDAEMPR